MASLSLSAVTKIKVSTTDSGFHVSGVPGGGMWVSGAGICEVSAWGRNYADIGLKTFDGSSIVKIACEPQGILTSPLRIAKGSITYGIVLVDPSDSYASKLRIKTNSGVKAVAKVE